MTDPMASGIAPVQDTESIVANAVVHRADGVVQIRQPGLSGAADPRPLSALVIGNSHSVALVKGIRRYGKETGRPVNIDRVKLADPLFQPNHTQGDLHPRLLTVLDGMTRAPHDLVVASVRGNYHSVIGLVRHPEPFDFVLEDDPDLPVDESLTLIPSAQMRDIMLEGIGEQMLAMLSALVDRLGRQVIAIGPPPPVQDNDYILANARMIQDGDFAQVVITPPLIRYKIWRLHALMLAEHCRAIGIRHVSPPADTLDGQGYLLPEFRDQDPTHGNAYYGRKLLDKILALG